MQLVGSDAPSWNDRVHFFAVASLIMRRVLIDHARRVRSEKRGGRAVKLSLDEDLLIAPQRADELLALDEALEALAERDPRKAKIVEMRFFGGMTLEEAAEAVGVSVPTVVREWRLARAWLYREVGRSGCSRR